MIRSPLRKFLLGLALGSILLPAVGWGGELSAQELPWLGKGQARLDFAPKYWFWDTRYGYRVGPSGGIIEEDELLSMDLAKDPLGSETLPYLIDLESNLGQAMGDEGFRVRLGASQAILAKSHLTFPFLLEVGVTDWLTVGAMVPMVRTRTEMDFILNGNAENADVGLSPLVTMPSAVNGFLGNFEDVLSGALEASPEDPTLLEAWAYLDAIRKAYQQGTLFPVEGSEAGGLLQARLDDLRSQLDGMGIVGVPTTVPLSEGYMTEAEFGEFLGTRRGMDALPLEDFTSPWALGDVEITASALLLRGSREPDSLGNGMASRYQLGVGGLVRLGTGEPAVPYRFFSVDPAQGQMDVEGSVFGRAEIGDRFGGWGHFRYGFQLEGEATRRITDPDGVLPNWRRTAPLRWTPGNYMDLELSPWFNFTPEMTFGVRYHFWHKGQDEYALQDMDPEAAALLNYPDPALLNLETEQTLQEVGISATYSTRAANDRGEARFPVLIRATYFRPISGSGGQTPKGSRLQVGLTLFRSIWGGRNDPSVESQELPGMLP